jgi:transcriptional regulator with XRE-family HTH domain
MMDFRLGASPLRLRRLATGLRIQDVARLTGLSATRISEIERGERTANIVESALIDRALARATVSGPEDLS